ncbi:Wzz/FepE/Etk N-terminal domain-containing protein [Luteimonas sp. YGD11-2]|uniref:GumC family protein n=1 Tax=Luteimonas sp. YGD11-2 TaxID=2508168 RepID=UPI00100A5644|nr:Wzz/FepE/Etk N-terminal domain-containing protein [Luteimonas sp. YGD11-2]
MDSQNLPAVPEPERLPASHTPAASYVPRHFVHPGLSLLQLLAIVWAWRRVTLAVVAGALLLALAASKLLPRTYTATATLMVNYEIYDPLGGKEFPIGLLGSYMATQIELMRSSEVLLEVVRRLGLNRDERYIAGFDGSPDRLDEWVKSRLERDLVIEQGRFGSQLIHITYSTNTPARAAAVVNTLAEVYAEQQHSRLTGPARERADRYTEQLQELQGKVARAQEEVTAFRARNDTIDPTAKIDIEMEMLGTLEQRLLETRNTRRTAESQLSGDLSVGDQVLNSPLVQTLKARLAADSARMAELRATLGPRHPQVMELESQIRHSRGALDAEMGNYRRNASSTVTASRDLEARLQQAVDEQREKVIAARQQQDELGKYELELDSAQSVYRRALEGYDQIMFASGGHYTNVRFVGPAPEPLKPSKPNLLKNLVLALAAGIVLGLLVPLAYELLFNRRVRCRDDLERDYDLPVLGEFASVPALRT